VSSKSEASAQRSSPAPHGMAALRGEGEAQHNRLLRRVDWRFLAGKPQPRCSLVPGGGMLAEALALVSGQVMRQDDGSTGADLAALVNPTEEDLLRTFGSLEPGGVFYGEWYKPRIGGISRLKDSLAEIGFLPAGAYWPWPWPQQRTPAFWLPLEARGALRYFLSSRPPVYSAKDKVMRLGLKLAWQAAYRGGLLLPVCIVAHKPYMTRSLPVLPPGSLQRRARGWGLAGSEEELDWLLLTGGLHSTNKVTGLVFRQGEDVPAYVVKMPRRRLSLPSLEREARLLEAVHSRLDQAGGNSAGDAPLNSHFQLFHEEGDGGADAESLNSAAVADNPGPDASEGTENGTALDGGAGLDDSQEAENSAAVGGDAGPDDSLEMNSADDPETSSAWSDSTHIYKPGLPEPGTAAPVGIPRLLFFNRKGSFPAIGQTHLAGVPLYTVMQPDRLEPLARQAAGWLVQLAGREAQAQEAYWERLVEPVLESFEQGYAVVGAAPLVNFARTELEKLGPLPPAVEHRDYSPWNIFLAPGGGLVVLDWEGAEPDGLPFSDLVYFLAYWTFFADKSLDSGGAPDSYRQMLDPGTPMGAIAAACTQSYCQEVGLPEESLRPLRLLTWLRHAVQERTLIENSSAGEVDPDLLKNALFLSLLKVELELKTLG
jgi:hypothetical protein